MFFKKKILIIVTTLSLIAVSLIYIIFFKSEDIKNYPSSGTEIIAFGDSLVEGVGATAGNDFVSILSKKIARPIINLGVSGDTTQDGLNRIGDLNNYNPKVVLLLLGGNDHLRKVPIDTTFSNLEKLIKNIQDRGAVVVLLGVRGGLLNDKFDSRYSELSKKYNTAYVEDVLSGLFADSRFMSDAIHPNNAGYKKIAERVYPVLIKLIR